jgi:hypothetical protein
MKKASFWLAIGAAVLSAGAALAATITVLVSETKVRRSPQFYAPSVGTAKLGDKLESSARNGGWFAVKGGMTGYVHESAVSAKKFSMGSAFSVGGSGPSADEITLAGKGFNAEVEKSYRGKHSSADFSGVNVMERRHTSESAVLDFARQGELVP